MDKKVINRILIITIIIVSVLGIAYKVFAFKYFDSASKEYYSEPPWVSIADEAGSHGVVQEIGGNSKDAKKQYDEGSLAVGVSSGGGGANSGYSGSWSSKINFGLKEEITSSASGFSPRSVQGMDNIIWYEDLCNISKVLCSAKGLPLTGQGKYVRDDQADGNYWVHDVDPTISPRTMTTYNLKESQAAIKSIASGDVKHDEYQKFYRTPCEYNCTPTKCTPAEAYVLSEADLIGGNSEKTPLQIAWWGLKCNDGGNDLSREAIEFENYVYGAPQGGNTTVTSAAGVEHSGAFPIKYEPKFAKTSSDVTVSFDEKQQKFIIGPYRINYYQVEKFAFMNKFEVFINDSETPINQSEYKIAVSSGGTISSINRMPNNGEEFYIILNYDENFRKISNIKAHFQYMNANGSYDYYTGQYTKVYVEGNIFGEFDRALYEDIEDTKEQISDLFWGPPRRALANTWKNDHKMTWTIGFTNADDYLGELVKYKDSQGGHNPLVFAMPYVIVSDYGEESLFDDVSVTITYTEDGIPLIIWSEYNRDGIQDYIDNYKTYENKAKAEEKAADEDDERADHYKSVNDPAKEGQYRKKAEQHRANAESYWKKAGNKDTYDACEKIIKAAPKPESLEEQKISIPEPLDFIIWKDLHYIPIGTDTAQAQSVSRGAAKWWQTATVEWEPRDSSGKIKITKEIDGEAKDGDEFEFKVKVGNKEENLKITYKNGGDNSVESSVYTWKKGAPAPTYEVTEATKNGYKLENITTKSGSLEEGKTSQVTVKNKAEEKNSTLEIYKEIKKTNLDTNQYTLVGKTYKFNVTISGDCEITYNGNTQKVTKEAPKTLQIDVISYLEGAPQSERDSKKIAVKWYKDVPTYRVEEIPNEQNNTPIAGSNLENIAMAGELRDKEIVKVEAQNKIIEQKAKIQIVKTLEGYENYSEEELKEFIFKFRVNVYSDRACTNKLKTLSGTEYEEQIIEAKLSRETENGVNVWKWVGSTPNDYKWAYGNYPYFKVEELGTCPYHHEYCQEGPNCIYVKNINFDKEKTIAINNGNSSIKEIEDTHVIGQLNENSATTGEFDCNVVNSTKATKGILKINKKVEANVENEAIKTALKNKDFNFTVKLKGTFTYKDILYEDKVIQLTTNGCNELNSIDEYNDKEFVVINLNGSTDNKTWNSDEITWYGKAPYYIVEEHTAGLNVTDGNGNTREINVSGVPQEGFLNEGTIEADKYNVTVNAKNSIDENAGYIKIIKKLENSANCSVDYIKQVRFKFDVKVFKSDGTTIVDEKTVVLGTEAFPAKYNEKENYWYWEWTSPRYSWDTTTHLKYSVEEKDEFPVGVSFVNVEGDNADPNNKKVTGVIKDSGDATNPDENRDEIKITTDAVFTNKVEARIGRLKIQKQLVKPGLDITQFKFKVTLNGTFFYNGEQKTGTYEFNVEGLDPSGTWTSEEIEWYGSAPSYVVEEIESDVAELVTMQNAVGTLKEGTSDPVTAIFINEGKTVGGHLKITKNIVGDGVAIDEIFKFKVTINNNGKDTVQYISVKANETWTSDYITWQEGDQIPTYKVEEIDLPEGSEFVEMKVRNDSAGINGRTVTGNLSKDKDIEVIANNKLQKRSGQFKVTKNIVFNKLIDTATQQEFTMDIKISGTFNIDGKQVNNGTHTITIKLKANQAYTSPKIVWYGDNAPVITVTERVKEGWDRPEYSNNGDTEVPLSENQTIEVVVTNRINVEMDLTMDLGGKVWEDEAQDPEGKNTSESAPNGLIDSSEKGLDGVEVYVYRVVTQNGKEIDRQLAVVHSNVYDSGMQNPVITSGGGNWKVTGLNVTGFTNAEKSKGYTTDRGYRVKYDVEFVYDGQTYEPTKALSYKDGNAYKNGSVQDYVGQSPTNRVRVYGNSSLAIDYDREQVNDRIREIYGKNPIDGSGNTISEVNGSEGTKNVNYKAEVPSNETTRVVSKLQTTNESGIADDLYKAKARTSTAGLQFPVDNSYKLEYTNTTYTLNGVRQSYKAIYGHCLHINLGLVKREEVDLEASKDLYSAKVVVDGKQLDYKFNKLSDIISKSKANKYDRVSDYKELDSIKYELGLYKTDYYYRAEIYKGNAEIYDNVQSYYVKTFGKIAEDSEIKVYLTYKINLYNNSSQKYKVKINAIDDYVEKSLGTPVSTKVEEVVNGKLRTVAVQSYSTGSDEYTIDENGGGKPSDAQNVEWQLVESNIKGADGSTYNKFKTKGNLNLEFNSGANKYIYVTFAVQKQTIDNIDDTIALGNKSNIVEIANYSTYYTDGKVAGKLDRDSAPSNLNIRNYNDEKIWYEDDTSAAPTLNLNLIGEEREMSGIAWEDKGAADTAIGDGERDTDEALIGGLTTQLVEKIKIPTPQGETEYDFLWPTHEKLDCLGGKSLEYLTGFDSTTETSRTLEKQVIDEEEKVVTEVGEYKFKGIPTGEYVVRFLYGNDKTELENTADISAKPAEALKPDGTKFGTGNEEILTANYDGDLKGSTQSVYNGQDYKSTIYQKGFTNTTPEGYLNNENHDLSSKELAEAKVSDARDSEYRRLDVIASSETITNKNSSVLSSANDLSADHKELYNEYGMFADSAKINFNIVSGNELPGVETTIIDGKVLDSGSVSITETYTKYDIRNIDFGLIERPETSVVLDKEISGIKLTTNDQKVIFEALYDISYEEIDKANAEDRVIIADLGNNRVLVAKVELNTSNSKGIDQLQAINKNETKPTNANSIGTQNFRFINVDAEILQGTTIELTYVITALNVGETDYTSATLENITNNREDNCSSVIKTKITELANIAKDNSTKGIVKLGEYLGTNYYTGKSFAGTGTQSDMVVNSKVRQVIDYVDNDGVFTPEYNTENNHMWRNTSITELTGNGHDENRLLDNRILPEYEILDKKNISYITPQKNNVILSTDSQNESAGGNTNAGFERKLIPYGADQTTDKAGYSSQIVLTVTRTVSAGLESSADNLTYDNLTEIVKFENTVGRRDVAVTAGNANPRFGEFTEALRERDSSATELVTFTPPTGIEVETQMTTQVLIITIVAIGIVILGIVVIKKKVLKNK